MSSADRNLFPLPLIIFCLLISAASSLHGAAITAVRALPPDISVPDSQAHVDLKVTLKDAGAETRIFAYHADEATPLENVGERAGDVLTVRLPIPTLEKLLAGRGRSLWLSTGELAAGQKTPANLSPKFRFDLPGVDLEGQIRITKTGGVQIKQQASNLLPGYRVMYCEYHANGTRGMPHVMKTEGPAPYLLPATAADKSTQLAIEWKSADENAAKPAGAASRSHTDGTRSWLLYVENIDGSRSLTKRLDWNGEKFTFGWEFQDAVAAPTDELAPVPDVTGMPLDRAAVLLAQAGFQPMPVTPESLALLPTSLFTPQWLRQRVVQEQGLAPGEPAPRGSLVYVSIQGDESEILAEARKSWIGLMPQGGLAGKTSTPSAKDKPGGLEDKTKIDPLAVDSPTNEKKDEDIPKGQPVSPTGGLSGTAKPGDGKKQPGGLDDSTTVLTRPIDPKTVDPEIPGEDVNDEGKDDPAKPKGGLAGTVKKPEAGKTPGGLDDTTQIDLLQPPIEPELPVFKYPDAGPPEEIAPVAATVVHPIVMVTRIRVPDVTGLKLAEAKAALEMVTLKESHEGNVAPDIDIVVSQDPKPGFQPTPKLVKLRFEVPVPNIRGNFQSALKILERHNLKSSVDLKGHEKHGCIKQDPPPYTKQMPSTLPQGGVVRVTLAALMPDLRGKTLEAATALLWQDELETDIDPQWRTSDIVTEQDPPPHLGPAKKSIVPLGSRVQIKLGRAVPDVEKLAVSEAKQRLTDAGFTPRAPEQGGESATVQYQAPRPDAIADIASEVSLGVQVTVPDVTGLTLAEAEERLQEAGFESKARDEADSADIVRGQSPLGGAINAELGSTVTLSPVVAKVPNVVGKSVDEANAELEDRGRFRVRYDEQLSSEDRITAQLPRAGAELERGGEVKLLSILKVPPVVGELPQTGVDAIAAVNLEAEMELDWVEGDRIVRQEPAAGRTVLPRSKVKLWFGREAPELRGLTEEQARRRLEEVAINGEIVPNTVQEETDDPSMDKKAIVFDQDPKPGRPIIRRVGAPYEMQLQMKTYVYVPPVMVRAYEGMDTATLDRALAQDGLFGRLTPRTPTQYTQNPRQANRILVLQQSIPAGTMVKRGTTIVFQCVKYQYYEPPPEVYQPPHPHQLPPSGGFGGGGGGTIGGGSRGGGGVF